ncbi:MAG: hypothetical protein JXK07_05760 [Spirochaetes bacterium]|nr:hypothetical protein [Spirochaetota bacterium]MBN2771733.1 hypothetical protein [Spirochaetota bacterium]
MKKIIILTVVLTITGILLGQSEEEPDKATVVAAEPGGARWGSSFDEVREVARGKLQFYRKDHYIITKDGEITYTYGFFYEDPEMLGMDPEEEVEPEPEPAGATAEGATDDEKTGEAQYLYGITSFPYLAMEDVKKKLIEKYGEPTAESIVRNSGVIIWDLETTQISAWIDAYEKKPYCRKIVYVSKEVSKKLKDYNYKIFNRKEIDTLNRIKP